MTDTRPFTAARQTLIDRRRAGMAGPLHFTYDDPPTATDVTHTFPWAKSLIVIAYNYLHDSQDTHADRPQIGRFATSDHYEPLRELTGAITELVNQHGHQAETLIDDNRLVDRAAAARAGVGWMGKSTMVLVPGHGPWTLLGTVVTDAILEPTPSTLRSCGTCTACVPACPTGAITESGLDARRCISAWLQAPGHLPYWIRPHIGTRIYGCDDCLTSCPPGHPAMLRISTASSTLDFEELLGSTDDDLRDRFDWWYIPNRDPRFLRRNIVVAAGNSGNRDLSGSISNQFHHRSSLVRGHAYWAYGRLLGAAASTVLNEMHAKERFPDALAELEQAILMLRRPVVREELIALPVEPVQRSGNRNGTQGRGQGSDAVS